MKSSQYRHRGLVTVFLLGIGVACASAAPSVSLCAPDRASQGQPAAPSLTKDATKGWHLRFPASAAQRELLRGAKPGEGVRVPVAIRQGKWMSGRLGRDGSVDVPLPDEDLSTFLPGVNRFWVQEPGWNVTERLVDANPLYRADADLAAYVEAHKQTIPLPKSPDDSIGRILQIPVGLRTRHLALGFSGVQPPSLPLSSSILLVTTDQRVLTPVVGRTFAFNRHAGFGELTLNLDSPETIEAILIDPYPSPPAMKVMGLQAWGPPKPGGIAALSPRARRWSKDEPLTLFAFDRPSIEGWETTGNAWGTTDTVNEFFMRKGTSRYFADSKAASGETGTGSILSPPFVVAGSSLTFLANGHGVKNYYALVDAQTGQELRRAPVPEKTGPFEKIRWDVKELNGRRVRFKAVDGDDRTAYAWLAFDDVTLEP